MCIVEPDVHGDQRGYFMETYNRQAFADIGITAEFVQDNQSYTASRGVLRGIHFQNAPMAQAKLVRVTKGAVLDVAVDLRKGSPTYKQWVAVELSEENKKQLLIPRRMGHGFVTLTDHVEFLYKADNFYAPAYDGGIRWNDPELNIDWGVENPVLSAKDQASPFLKDAVTDF